MVTNQFLSCEILAYRNGIMGATALSMAPPLTHPSAFEASTSTLPLMFQWLLPVGPWPSHNQGMWLAKPAPLVRAAF
jgi:hypothetical protein